MIFILVGPTCSGKTSLEAALAKMGCGKAISHTTRAPRAGEVNGVDYHFVTEAGFARMWQMGDFIEMVSFGGNNYAMSAASLATAQKASDHVVIVAEPDGAGQISSYCGRADIECVRVWVDCGPNERARRFVARMLADSWGGKEVVGPYTARLGAMLGAEKDWYSALSYNRTILTDERTPEQCAEHLLAMQV